jgi:hypothetical protein
MMETPPVFDPTIGVAGNLEAMEAYMLKMAELPRCVEGRTFEQWLHAIPEHVSARSLLPVSGIIIDERLHQEGHRHQLKTLLRIQNKEGQVLAVVENGTVVKV